MPWHVVGGWAIDLFLGEQSRPHEDLEISVLRPDFSAVRQHLAAFAFHVVGDGEVQRLRTGAEPPEDRHQNWVLDEAAQAWRMDVMLEPGDENTWVFRRDSSISAERGFMEATTGDGVPFLRPHGALLYKAKATREKDEADFTNCLPRMGDGERQWLAVALAAAHPEHPWIPRLG